MLCLSLIVRYALMLLIFHSQLILRSSSSFSSAVAPQCDPEESSALLTLKAAFPYTPADTSFLICRSIRFSGNEEILYLTMASWNESTNCCTWDGVECDGDSGHVIGLRLSCSSLQGPIRSDSSLFLLRHLQKLDLSHNDFRGSPVPAEFGRFRNMTHLDLSSSNFGGQLPPEISHLSNLGSFKFYAHGESRIWIGLGTFKALTRNLTKLNELKLRDIDMSSVPLISLRNLSSSLTSLELISCELRGKIPENGFELPNLEDLFLQGNHIEGLIPQSFFNLFDKMNRLDLSSNNLIGQIPEVHHNNFSTLTSLDLFRNALNGTIPSWIYAIPSLLDLGFAENHLTGELGEFKSSSLYAISLGKNKLHGVIPRAIFQDLSSLEFVDLSSNNFTGSVDLEDLSKLEMLSYLDISSNRFSFKFDNSKEYRFDFLYYLGFSSCNITDFPKFLRSLTSLDTLDLSRNRIHGSVPKWLWEMGKDSLSYLNLANNFLMHMDSLPWNKLEVLDIRSNFLLGTLPITFSPNLTVFRVSKNHLSGDLPASFCKITSLKVLDVSYNNLTGKIPPCFGNFSPELSVLDLRMNRFHGMIPLSFAKGNALRTLNLNGNQFDGSLPRSLLECKNLEVLDVGNNKINGRFPEWLESLPELQVLILRSNGFYGPISKGISSLPFQKLKIMDLSNNIFTGTLPDRYFRNFAAMINTHSDNLAYLERDYYGGQQYYEDSVVIAMKGVELKLEKILTILTTIDLSRNKFDGQIPTSIGKLKSLKGLNLSDNKLAGQVPSSLRNLTNLEWLDLSSNELSGRIPWEFTDLIHLQFLNLSRNRLEGPIPTGRQFNTFANDSYIGNSGLCGFPMSESCSSDEARQVQEDDNGGSGDGIVLDVKVVMMGYASGVVIGISIGYMVLYTRTFNYWFIRRFGREPRHNAIAPVGGRRRN